MPYKRPYENAPSAYAMPFKRRNMTTMLPSSVRIPARSNTSFKSNSYRNKSGGPYRVMTGGMRHTNPIYPKPECKIFDCDAAAVTPPPVPPTLINITNAGVVACVNAIPTGTGVGGFTGNQVSIKSIAYRYELDLGGTPVPTSGRVILVWDKQPNGALAAFTDIFAGASYLSFGNVNSRDRFVILRNDQFSLSPNGDQTLFYDRFVKVNMTTTYTNGTAGSVPTSGALLLCYISDQGTAANQPKIAGNVRIRYFDN